MKYAHKKCRYTGTTQWEGTNVEDKEALAALEAKLTISMSGTTVSDKALCLAGLFYWHTGDVENAVASFKSALVKNANSITAMIGLGWIDVDLGVNDTKRQRKVSQALEVANRIIAYFPNFIPALVERLYILQEMLSWDTLLEAAQRLSGVSNDNIDAMIMITWYEICCEGPSETVATFLKSTRKVCRSALTQAIEKLEPDNPDILYETSRPFTRLANQNAKVLEECEAMIQNAARMNPQECAYQIELGYIQFLTGNLQKSKESYDAATKLDAHNIPALEGIIQWLILTEQYAAAQEQLEMFTELQRSIGLSSTVAHLNSVLALKKHKDHDLWLSHLKEALQIQLKAVQGKPITMSYYVLFNPEFILSIVKSYLNSNVWHNLRPEDADQFQRILKDILDILLRIVPGSTESLYFIAKTQLLLGDPASAESHLQKAIQKNKTDLKAYLLLSEIHSGNKNFKAALSALEMALSFDFAIRQDPAFLLLKAECLNGQESYAEALTVLKTAFNLASVRDCRQALEKRAAWNKSPTTIQLALLYQRLIECQSGLNSKDEVTATLAEALKLFKDTPQESIFVIANAKAAIRNGDINYGLELLSAIKPSQSSYLEARSLMADIYLNKQRDRKRYAACFREVVEKRPTVDSCLMLGDAFMKIQEPQEAVAVYQSALKTYPDQTVFVGKIGNAYVMMHDYSKATSYYKAAIAGATSDKVQLQLDLGRLLLRLNRLEEGREAVQEAIDALAGSEYPTITDVKLKCLQADLLSALHEPASACSQLVSAKDTLLRILSFESGRQGEAIQDEIASVCVSLGSLMMNQMKDYDRAAAYLGEALQFQPQNEKASLLLSKIHMKKGDLAAAQVQLSNVLEKDTSNAAASIAMAHLLCEKASFQSAFFHYRQILENDPANFEILSQFIDIARRLDKLDEVSPYFEAATNSSKKTKISLGFHYCKGLYLRYTSSLNDALKQFVICRNDSVWGERAIYNLIEMFLNPGDETLGGEALDATVDNTQSTTDLNADMDLVGVMTADKLLMDLPQSPKSLKTQILECHSLMASKQKSEIEKAISVMLDILKAESDYVPALYGTALGFVLLKQSPRARNQLKRVSKMEWSQEFGEDIEKCWILLADIYIQGGKYDLATELLNKVIAVNQSSSKAFEYLGFIMEKEQAYKDAADYYAKCWKLQRQSTPAIGFKLAFNYLKAKRYMDAIDISHIVLKAYPDYPKIQKEILEKSRASLRL
ncbi:Tetratricopeptide repeat protein 21B [Kappamyces sp. JEL0829]|nr:Tetratricopeptide repeat protein 21B [Kappamyces sp. JEL0829]